MAAKNKSLKLGVANNFDSPTGKGVVGQIGGQTIALGNRILMEENNIDITGLSAKADELRTTGATVISCLWTAKPLAYSP